MGRFHRRKCECADGACNVHDGRDVRDVKISTVVIVVVVAIVRELVGTY